MMVFCNLLKSHNSTIYVWNNVARGMLIMLILVKLFLIWPSIGLLLQATDCGGVVIKIA